MSAPRSRQLQLKGVSPKNKLVAAMRWRLLNRLLARAGYRALLGTVTWNHNETISRIVSSGDECRRCRAPDVAPEPYRIPASRRRMGGVSLGRPAKRCVVGANASRARRVLDAVLPLPVDVLIAVQDPALSLVEGRSTFRFQDAANAEHGEADDR